MIGNDDQDYDPNWGPEDEYGDGNDDVVDDEEDVPDKNREVIGEDAEGDPIYEDEFDWDPEDYWRAQNQQIIAELKRTGKARLAMSFGLPPDVSSEIPGPRVGDQLEVTKFDEGRFWKVSPPNLPWHALVVSVLHKEFEPLDLSTYTANSVVLDFLSRTNVPFRLSIAAIESGHYATVDVTLYSNALTQIAGERELPATTNKTTAHSKGQLPDASKSNRTCPRCSSSDFYGDGSCRSCGRKPDLFDAAASVARDSWNGVKSKLKEWAEESPAAGKKSESKPASGPMNFSNQAEFFHHIDEPAETANKQRDRPIETEKYQHTEPFLCADEIPPQSQIEGTLFNVSLGVRPEGAMEIANRVAANSGFKAPRIDKESIRFSNGIWDSVNLLLTFRGSPRGTDAFLIYSGERSGQGIALTERMLTELASLAKNFLKAAKDANVGTTTPPRWSALARNACTSAGDALLDSILGDWAPDESTAEQQPIDHPFKNYSNAIADDAERLSSKSPASKAPTNEDGSNNCSCGCFVLALIIGIAVFVGFLAYQDFQKKRDLEKQQRKQYHPYAQ